MVLDEATSALDSVTERQVQKGIAELMAGKTSLVIAHRLSTVESVDKIVVLDEGKLIAFGTHKALMKDCDTYREMVELQQYGLLAE
jgi:ATP-binding cassette subfamily B protein